MGVAEMTIDSQRAEQIVGRNLLVNNLMQLLAADRMVKGFYGTAAETGSSPQTAFFCSGRAFTRAAVGTQLINPAAKRDQLAVEFIKSAEPEITVLQQVRNGGGTFVDAAEQGRSSAKFDIARYRDAERKNARSVSHRLSSQVQSEA